MNDFIMNGSIIILLWLRLTSEDIPERATDNFSLAPEAANEGLL